MIDFFDQRPRLYIKKGRITIQSSNKPDSEVSYSMFIINFTPSPYLNQFLGSLNVYNYGICIFFLLSNQTTDFSHYIPARLSCHFSHSKLRSYVDFFVHKVVSKVTHVVMIYTLYETVVQNAWLQRFDNLL